MRHLVDAKMENNSFNLNLKGCVKSKGIVCVPLPELIKLFEKFPYHLGKQFKELLEKANVSDKIEEVKECECDIEYPHQYGCKFKK